MVIVKADKQSEAEVMPPPDVRQAAARLPEMQAHSGPRMKEENMFGKRISEYVGFQKGVLVLIAVVGLARLGLSLAGLPDSTVTWLSMNVVGWAAVVYYGVAVHTSGFGGYKQLLPLGIFQILLMQSIAVLGILLAIAGLPNIFAAPEYSFAVQNQWIHLLSHLTIGIIVPPLLLWAVASLILLVTRRVARRRLEA